MVRVVITASGGGHTGYDVALAQRLHGRADLLFIIPRSDKWTRSKVEQYGEVVETIGCIPIESTIIRRAGEEVLHYSAT